MNDDLTQLELEGRARYSEHDFASARQIAHELYERTHDVRYALLEADCAYQSEDAEGALSLIAAVATRHGDTPTTAILRAQYLRALGKFDESEAEMEKVPTDVPGYYSIHGWHLLRRGKFVAGMTELEREPGIYREETRHAYPKERRLKQGETLSGLTVLYVLEGGLGDQVAFARFGEVLHKRGARVVVECSASLISVLSRVPYFSSVGAHGGTPVISYDRFLPAQSAITILEIDSPGNNITFPYLTAQEHLRTALLPSLEAFAQGRRRIGLHWQGNWSFDWNEKKSPPALLMRYLVPHGALFSLQRDAGQNTLPGDIPHFDAESGPASWEHTIAVMSRLDVVVSNCTSTAHIAGALGIPTILLARHAPHYYWATTTLGGGTETTEWYPSLRVVRQPRSTDWEGAIRRATDIITALPPSLR